MPLSENQDLKNTLQPGHPLHTLVLEHEAILGFLDRLEKVNTVLQKTLDFKKQKELEELSNIAQHLIEAEPHHKREEGFISRNRKKRGFWST